MNDYYIANVSWGKDSTAMLLKLIECKYTLNEVCFYDTGMEFDAIYRLRDKFVPLLAERGIKYSELTPKNAFIYDMLQRPVESSQNGKHNGYGWCGGVCRWGTTAKAKALDENAKKHNAITYVGIAADELVRLDRLPSRKEAPLAKMKMTEADCLNYCRSCGIDWLEETTATASGYIDLYDILDRVSCWCCANKNRKELYNIWRYLPQYWDKLLQLQGQIARPMKKFCNLKYGEYGNLFDLENIFEREAAR